jgi:hypothetical protein
VFVMVHICTGLSQLDHMLGHVYYWVDLVTQNTRLGPTYRLDLGVEHNNNITNSCKYRLFSNTLISR